MARDDKPLLICDLTQSYSPSGGGGISTYLKEKRRHVLGRTDHRLIQIVPGPEDRIVEDGRHIWVEIGAEPVRGSPNYRFITRTRKVHEVLEHYRPDIIESLCPYILPWTAINFRRKYPATTLVAGYHTDFPNAHIYRVGKEVAGETIAGWARRIMLGYAGITYREFDRVYTLGEDAKAMLAEQRIDRVDVLDLGVDLGRFDPAKRDPHFRARLGLRGEGPLLIYAGRIDNEKRADMLVEMMKRLPREFGADLVMLGDGKLRDELMERAAGDPIAFPGFVSDREALAVALASADLYVSAMADETFGISVIEAQASGLPVIGVDSGEMPARVPPGLGLLGPVDDAEAMAKNVMQLWRGDHLAVSRAARDHVVDRYSWERTFSRLFYEVYPAALAHTRQRLREMESRGPRRRLSQLLGETV
ncbi:MAG: glycosyltransferase family 1 protein [Proteobacteria bacterium]|nr:glycosyltransferase family 1 protein [Pseudomonadota bacterium]